MSRTTPADLAVEILRPPPQETWKRAGDNPSTSRLYRDGRKVWYARKTTNGRLLSQRRATTLTLASEDIYLGRGFRKVTIIQPLRNLSTSTRLISFS